MKGTESAPPAPTEPVEAPNAMVGIEDHSASPPQPAGDTDVGMQDLAPTLDATETQEISDKAKGKRPELAEVLDDPMNDAEQLEMELDENADADLNAEDGLEDAEGEPDVSGEEEEEEETTEATVTASLASVRFF